MKLFSCDHCHALLFFENSQCGGCREMQAFVPQLGIFKSIPPEGTGAYRHCKNRVDYDACNWAVAADEVEAYCLACRLNQVIPDLSVDGAKSAWMKIEIAKRRLMYSLIALKLPLQTKAENPTQGLTFAFLRDEPVPGAPRVITGHADGMITLNVAEADDPFREKMRVSLGEAYRTLLGHFRHEVGHYYWDRLIRDTDWLERFRALFGDERADYAAAVKKHYDEGAPADWATHFVSAYASTHPWEDWAETWAHYLHMVDTLETARLFGLSLEAVSVPEPAEALPKLVLHADEPQSFEEIISSWFPLTFALNSLNRSMGLHDWYPFVLANEAIEKLRFVHQVVDQWRDGAAIQVAA